MRLFESDNLWKRKRRLEDRAARPDTPEQRLSDARDGLRSTLTWLLGAAVLLVLGLVGLRAGVIVPDTITVVFLVVLGLYVAISVGPALGEYRAFQRMKREED